MLEIIFENEHLIAINKPHGLLVHRSPIAKDAKEFALQLLRDQIGQYVYPAHRLDRKTSGVLLFSKAKETNIALNQLFAARKVRKQYLALVRGFCPKEGTIDYAIKENDKPQEAITHFQLKAQYEIPLAHGGFDTSRYSLVEVYPETGRFHQIRKHLAHIDHPIIGDRPHGCNKQNRLWKEQFKMTHMLLHAEKLNLEFPMGNPIEITANLSAVFSKVLNQLNQMNILKP